MRVCPANTRVAIIEDPGRSIRVDRTDLVGEERSVVEDSSAVEVIRRVEERRPPDTPFESQPLGCVEGVLNVQAGNRSPVRILLRLALLEAVHGAPQKVKVAVADSGSTGRPIAAIGAVEAEDPVALISIIEVELVLHILAANDDLVLAAHQGQVVRAGEGVVIDDRKRVGAAAHAEAMALAGRSHAELQTVRQQLRIDDSNCRCVDIGVVVAAIIADPHSREVSRVHRVRVDRPVLAEGEALLALAVAGLRGNQNVGRRIECRRLITVNKVPAIEVVLRVNRVVDTGNELIVGMLRRNGVGHQAATIDINGRVRRRQVLL